LAFFDDLIYNLLLASAAAKRLLLKEKKGKKNFLKLDLPNWVLRMIAADNLNKTLTSTLQDH
jgi:hypothetical protein